MSQKLCIRGYRIWLLALSWVCASVAPSVAGDVLVQGDGKASAKGLLLLRATFPVRGEVGHIQLLYSCDGEEFQEAGIGLPRPWQLFSSTSSNEEETTVFVPAVAHFRLGQFRFDEPGTHYLRWSVGIKNVRGFNFDQVLEVEPAHAADLAFIDGLAKPELMRAMFGEDFFERLTGNAIEHYADPEVRAVKVIGQLLSVTREKTPGQAIAWYGPHGDIRKAAEMLLALARDIPESNYAPYAAYYAGFCYVSIASTKLQDALRSQRTAGQPRDKTAETTQLVAFFQNDPDCAKTQESFTLAAQRADDYLKPRVLCQQAGLSVAGGAFDDAEKLLTRALEMAPGERTIQKWVDKTRKEADRMRAELEEGEERVSTTEEPGESE